MATFQSPSNLYKEMGSLTLKYLFLIILCLDYVTCASCLWSWFVPFFFLHCEITGCGKRLYCDKLTVYKQTNKQTNNMGIVFSVLVRCQSEVTNFIWKPVEGGCCDPNRVPASLVFGVSVLWVGCLTSAWCWINLSVSILDIILSVEELDADWLVMPIEHLNLIKVLTLTRQAIHLCSWIYWYRMWTEHECGWMQQCWLSPGIQWSDNCESIGTEALFTWVFTQQQTSVLDKLWWLLIFCG